MILLPSSGGHPSVVNRAKKHRCIGLWDGCDLSNIFGVSNVLALFHLTSYGTASAEAILKRYNSYDRTHPTYKALAEVGKAEKTIFLCDYLPSRETQREIHEGLNVVENWNATNDFICYGRQGELATKAGNSRRL